MAMMIPLVAQTEVWQEPNINSDRPGCGRGQRWSPAVEDCPCDDGCVHRAYCAAEQKQCRVFEAWLNRSNSSGEWLRWREEQRVPTGAL